LAPILRVLRSRHPSRAKLKSPPITTDASPCCSSQGKKEEERKERWAEGWLVPDGP